MGDKTGIEWTDATWNPLRGCTRVSEGCRNCYAEGVAARFSGPGQPYEGLAAFVGAERLPRWTGKVALAEHLLDQPLRWKKPRRIFVNSMSDLFHESVPDEWIDRVFAVMALAPQHTFQILTKRPERMREYIKHNGPTLQQMAEVPQVGRGVMTANTDWPLPNVWLGVSVEDQATADERIPLLLNTPAAKRFISAEPLLGPIDLMSTKGGTLWIGGQRGCGGTHRGDGSPGCPREPHHHHDERCKPGLDWVIVGGESGPNARPMHPDWARSLRDQCAAAGVPYFFKQWGELAPQELTNDGRPEPWRRDPNGYETWALDELGKDDLPPVIFRRVGKKAAGHLLDGREHREFPA